MVVPLCRSVDVTIECAGVRSDRSVHRNGNFGKSLERRAAGTLRRRVLHDALLRNDLFLGPSEERLHVADGEGRSQARIVGHAGDVIRDRHAAEADLL
jgi:hypothetical protein